jgi:phosphonoacetate hydrolase
MPTFTNPNNMSIVTGAPPRVHGISGNYYLDRATGREVMITDASLVSSGTVLAALADAGVRVAAILHMIAKGMSSKSAMAERQRSHRRIFK